MPAACCPSTLYRADIFAQVSRDRPLERCAECGNVVKLNYVGPEEDPHARMSCVSHPMFLPALPVLTVLLQTSTTTAMATMTTATATTRPSRNPRPSSTTSSPNTGTGKSRAAYCPRWPYCLEEKLRDGFCVRHAFLSVL